MENQDIHLLNFHFQTDSTFYIYIDFVKYFTLGNLVEFRYIMNV